MNKTRHDDEKLLALFKNKTTRDKAFKQIVSTYSEPLYWHIRNILISHEDSDDILQNTFIKVWNNLHKFRANSSLYTWLYRIATNESLSFLRTQKKNNLISITNETNTLENELKSDPYFDGDELLQDFHRCVLSLPEKQRLVFSMKYFEEMKYEEISNILKTSIGSLKASYHHAVKKIENSIKKNH